MKWFALLSGAPLLVFVLQRTIGEANVLVYASMPVPTLAWATLPVIGLLAASARRNLGWAIAHFATLIVLLVGQGALATGRPVQTDSAPIRVVTMNVQMFRDYDGHEMAKELLAIDPDIIFLQELTRQHDDQRFADLFKGYTLVQEGRLGILSRFPILRVHRWSLREDRRALGVELDVWGSRLLAVCLHLQHFPSDKVRDLPQASRNLCEEAAALEAILDEHRDMPILLAGDLNAIPLARVNRMLRARLSDCFATTSTGYGHTVPAQRPFLRIDYIYAGNGLRPIGSRVLPFVLSDHRAVAAEVSLAP